jgi:hypothetical protein
MNMEVYLEFIKSLRSTTGYLWSSARPFLHRTKKRREAQRSTRKTKGIRIADSGSDVRAAAEQVPSLSTTFAPLLHKLRNQILGYDIKTFARL